MESYQLTYIGTYMTQDQYEGLDICIETLGYAKAYLGVFKNTIIPSKDTEIALDYIKTCYTLETGLNLTDNDWSY